MVYASLAQIYDKLMIDIDYGQWVDYLIWQIEEHQAPGKVVLDLGCGTGSIAVPLAQKGYKVTGLDISIEMLTQAEQKARNKDVAITLLQQDIEELELDFQVDIVIATFDTFNYILDKESLSRVFQRLYSTLRQDGLVIFDLNTPHKLSEVLGENTFTYNSEELVYIWENFYDEEAKVSQMDLTFFALEEDNRYQRFEETHLERSYEKEEIEELLINNGFKVVGVYGELKLVPPEDNEERIFFVAKKEK